MRVALLNPTVGNLSGGYRKYLRVLVPMLRADRRVTELRLFAPEVTVGLVDPEVGPVTAWPGGSYAHQSRWLRQAMGQMAPDVVFIPTARWIDFGEVPVVTMVRNMEPLTVPWAGNPVREGLRNVARARLARRACLKADRVIAVSRFVRDFVVEKWQVEAVKVGVVHHGVEVPPPPSPSAQPDVLRTGSMNPFVFTAGSVRPARGLEDAIAGLAEVHRLGLPLSLVVAGDSLLANAPYRERLRSFAAQCGVDSHMVWAGELSSSEMAWCFRHCIAFVMTSRAEACPNVLLEAMANGALCVSTDRLPMPELLGDQGLYYPAGDQVALGQQLRAASILDDAARRRLQEATVARARHFDWGRTAEATVTQLEMAAGSRVVPG